MGRGDGVVDSNLLQYNPEIGEIMKIRDLGETLYNSSQKRGS